MYYHTGHSAPLIELLIMHISLSDVGIFYDPLCGLCAASVRAKPAVSVALLMRFKICARSTCSGLPGNIRSAKLPESCPASKQFGGSHGWQAAARRTLASTGRQRLESLSVESLLNYGLHSICICLYSSLVRVQATPVPAA